MHAVGKSMDDIRRRPCGESIGAMPSDTPRPAVSEYCPNNAIAMEVNDENQSQPCFRW